MTDMGSFIMFKDRLNNFWVIKSREYCWKKVCQNESVKIWDYSLS